VCGNYVIFYPLEETAARDLRPLVFSGIDPILTPDSYIDFLKFSFDFAEIFALASYSVESESLQNRHKN
jgi:hypothetical protein